MHGHAIVHERLERARYGVAAARDLAVGLFEAGDVAMATGTLTLSSTGHSGQPFTHSSSSIVVYSRGADGWRIALDAPWGLPEA